MAKKTKQIRVSINFEENLDDFRLDLQKKYNRPFTLVDAMDYVAKMLKNQKKSRPNI